MAIISNHNKSLLSVREGDVQRPCNCTKYACPLNGECRSSAIIYQATVKTSDTSKTKNYIGMAETEFKLRFYNHESSFRNLHHRNKTTLSQHVWQLKSTEEPFDVEWRLLAKSRPYVCGSRKCNLCIAEKYHILKHQSSQSLNKRNEIANRCKHKAKFKLKNIS